MSFGVGIGDLIKLGEVAGRVYKNCRDCTGDYKHLTTEARSLTNLLDDIQDKYDKIPSHKRKQLLHAYDPCIDVLSELDKLLVHYNSLDTKSKRAWDRLKWDPERSRSLRERLASSVVMLNAFYNSLIHDNQVLILEALERLEQDYKGGYREESIASIERIATSESCEREDEDGAAWSQIIRDLEDVGISHKVALTYHDFVVDWFVRAVNEGRLVEEPRTVDSLSSTRPPSSIGFHQDILSTSLAATKLSEKKQAVYTEGISEQSTDANLLRRSNSSDAADPLHSLNSQAMVYNSLLSRHLSYDVPEPKQFSSPSLQAPETVHGENQVTALEGFPLANEASQALQPLLFSASLDLNERAHGIIHAWSRHEFAPATKLLEDQLAAVEEGLVTFRGKQPDRRVLRHCIGVCASFSGDLLKAKYFFESAFNGIYLTKNLDEGDIAAARWLGDVCLQLREFPNTVLAWSVALEGSVRRYGISHDRTRQIVQEMLKLDEWVSAFRDINHKFLANVDPTDIFSSTHILEKRDLVRAIQIRVDEGRSRPKVSRPSAALRPRPPLEMIPNEALLTDALVSSGAWPLQWDSMFSPMAVYQTQWYMKIARPVQPTLGVRSLRTSSLVESKKLDFVTKAGSAWLVETVKAILRRLNIEHAEHPDENAIICCLQRERCGLACSEGVVIGFSKLQFRNVCGVKISDVRWSTRKPPPPSCGTNSSPDPDHPTDTAEFRNTVKELLDLADTRSSSTAPITDKIPEHSRKRSWRSRGIPKGLSTAS